MELIWARASRLVRRGARATIFLALLAGLAAGVSMAMVAAGRRTATAYDRFFAHADVPELLINFCPPQLEAGPDVDLGVCYEDERAVVAVLDDPALRPVIDQAAFITGVDLQIGDAPGWVHAYVPIEDVAEEAPPLPIHEGRPTATAREIAVGSLTLEETGLSIGDRVMVGNVATGDELEMTIVGTAMINDNFESSPGRGGVVTPELIAELAPEIRSGDPAIVSLRPGADVDEFIEAVSAEIDTPVQRPLPQAALLNVERIRELPFVMAAVVALLAVASLVHALVLSVSRNRRVLGVLKGLGFTRRQVAGTIAWHATSYAVAATVVALPLGVMAGRWGWRMVAQSLGVPDVPVLPVLVLGVVVVALVLLANLAAAYPGWRAARLSTAAALRAE